MQYVFVVDAERHPLMPCRPARARLLLSTHKAALLRMSPFTIRLKTAKTDAVVLPLRLKIDPVSQTTGLALVRETASSSCVLDPDATEAGTARTGARCGEVIWAADLTHRGNEVHMALDQRRAARRSRRHQHGTLAGTEVREFLLLKWGYRCAYCHKPATTTNPWQLDHIVPRSRGGSDRPSNLALSCRACNQAKGDCTAAEFGHPKVQAQAKAPLKDAAAVNSARRALHTHLQALGLPVETSSGGPTKWNRTERSLPKIHWLDAACESYSTPKRLHGWRDLVPLGVRAHRSQRWQTCLMDQIGFPRTMAKVRSRVHGLASGDRVQVVVPVGSKAQRHVGTVSVRARGVFNIATAHRLVRDISYRYCQLIQHADGYTYAKGDRAVLRLP